MKKRISKKDQKLIDDFVNSPICVCCPHGEWHDLEKNKCTSCGKLITIK